MKPSCEGFFGEIFFSHFDSVADGLLFSHTGFICFYVPFFSVYAGVCIMATQVKYMGFDCHVVKQKYPGNQQIALQLITREGHPVATATSCLVNYPFAPDQTAIKNFNENHEILETLIAAGIIQEIGISVQSGYCCFPIVKVLI